MEREERLRRNRARWAKWYAAHKDIRKKQNHEFYLRHKDYFRKFIRRHYPNNLERYEWWNKHSKYGISREQVEDILKKQAGKCAICRVAFRGFKKGPRSIEVDHSHKNGKVRGLLCHRCNIRIGCIENNKVKIVGVIMSDAEWLEKAGIYLNS